MNIFVSYASADRTDVEKFFRHIDSLPDVGCTIKSDKDIPSGADWADWIGETLESVDGAILLISDAFLISNWCKKEATELYSRLQPVRILPVLVRSCLWTAHSWLKRYQLVNTVPAVETSADPDTRWTEIVTKVSRSIGEWSSERSEPKRGVYADVGIDTLEEALSAKRGVAFFLGPGIHEMRGGTRAADHLRARFDLLADKLGVEQGPVAYVKSVVDAKLPGALDWPPLAPVPKPNEDWRDDLVAFQASLARLGSLASQLVARAISQRHIALVDIGTLRVSLEDKEETCEDSRARIELRNLFFQACQQVNALAWNRSSPSKQDIRNIGLGVQGILEKLMALTYVAFGRDLEQSNDLECRDWHKAFGGLHSRARSQIQQLRLGPGRRFLALTHLDWLGDLLWHTLRFDTPLYLRPSDLAFQLSVCAPQFTPPRRESVGTIAPVALRALRSPGVSIEDVQGDVKKVTDWLMASATADHHDIYYAVARALCDVRNHQGQRGGGPHQVPIAVTTNFDNTLEQILRSARISHQILFPVHYVRKSRTRDQGAPARDERRGWMLYKELWEQGSEYPSRFWSIEEGDALGKLDDSGAPLLVKLYGSPLTQIESKAVDVIGRDVVPNRDGLFEFAHDLIVSDLDLLDCMVHDRWPNSLARLIFGHRLICFLGYSPADIDNRLRLFEHTRHSEESYTVSVVVINPPEDAVYSKYLQGMRTQALSEDLDKICKVISRSCKCPALDSLRTVQ